ncbi:hypothetical protein EDC04DRAFT_3145415 [Pisolithus marmoratus]|nr:hypothetical protein EDC04DRAFT_3145415 [Pisolithus marmoratus]
MRQTSSENSPKRRRHRTCAISNTPLGSSLHLASCSSFNRLNNCSSPPVPRTSVDSYAELILPSILLLVLPALLPTAVLLHQSSAVGVPNTNVPPPTDEQTGPLGCRMVPTVVKREMLFGRTAKESDDGDAAVFTWNCPEAPHDRCSALLDERAWRPLDELIATHVVEDLDARHLPSKIQIGNHVMPALETLSAGLSNAPFTGDSLSTQILFFGSSAILSRARTVASGGSITGPFPLIVISVTVFLNMSQTHKHPARSTKIRREAE